MAVPGASILSAQDFDRWRDARRDSQDIRQDYQHIGNDYANLDAMRFHMAQDQARLNEDIRCGRDEAAARDAQDLARDQRALNAQIRDSQHDRANLNYERRDFGRDYRNQWYGR
jgi:hypothetical protein